MIRNTTFVTLTTLAKLATCITCFILISQVLPAGEPELKVGPIPKEVRQEFKLSPFYKQHLLISGFPIVSSEKVHPKALQECAAILQAMLKNSPKVLKELAKNNVRYSVMAVSERTCDIPEHSDLTPSVYWNRRARGLGPTAYRPSVSCGEENLLHNPGDPYYNESICIHEFAHSVHELAMNTLDPTFDKRLQKAYRAAMDKGLWKDTYAGSNHKEYWAEAVQSWFDCNPEKGAHHVNTREELQEYDPNLAKLCAEVFGANDWRYVRSDDASRKKEPHLRDLVRSELLEFRWTKEEQVAYDKLEQKKAE